MFPYREKERSGEKAPVLPPASFLLRMAARIRHR